MNLIVEKTRKNDVSNTNGVLRRRISRFMALNVICCETAIRLKSEAKRKWLACAQNVADTHVGHERTISLRREVQSALSNVLEVVFCAAKARPPD